jgi:UDP-N-acetylmuramoyl-tripeptide--D-alanyl-D-alanine ligase
MRFRASDVAAATNGRLIGDDADIDGVSFDSRTVADGQLFVPIVAERDGHDYVAAALEQGAAAYLTSRPTVDRQGTAIQVVDTAAAFLDLAKWARGRVPDRVVGITGSVGKTSTKDFAKDVLAARWRTTANEKSFNNDQGLPSTTLNAPDDVEVLVLEMGMRGFGEIARLCDVARPTVGAVTRVGAAHTERLGGIDGVAGAKAELVRALPASGTAILNADDDRVVAMAVLTTARVLTFGLAGDVRITRLRLDERGRARFVLATPWGDEAVQLNVSGEHMAENAAAAAAIGLVLDVPLAGIGAALAGASLSPWRMDVLTAASGGVLINDAYNANPTSMRAALDTLASIPARRRIAVLGLMAEIDDPRADHEAIAGYARERGIEIVAYMTDLYGQSPAPDPVSVVGSIGGDDAVLIKGSRVCGLERFVDGLLGIELSPA